MFRNAAKMSVCAVALTTAVSMAQDGPRLEPLHVSASWEAGQIESFEKDAGGPVAGDTKQLMNHSSVWMLQEARLSDRARAYVGVGGMYFFVLPSTQNQYSFGQRSAFGLTDAHLEYDAVNGEKGGASLRVKVGVFPYKYNSDAKNLGEYMFRTYTYPNIITTGGLVVLNSAGSQLNGAVAEMHFGDLKNDLLLTVKTDQVPSAALSLTDIVSYQIGDFLTVGAGYMFDNFYSADGLNDGKGSDPSTFPQEYYWELADGSHVLFGSALNPGDSVVATKHFSFKGQKAVWRAAVDIGNLLPGALFTPNAFKVYYEGVLMGVEDRPIFYENRSDRIAHMFGVNVPTFGVLDVLSAEVEYCSNPYAPDMSNATLYLSPTPKDNQGSEFTSDDLKWSFYARKTLLPGFSVTAQAARDHSRLVDYFGHTNDMEILPKRKNWYWAVQLAYAL
jgi:hypothetical protein